MRISRCTKCMQNLPAGQTVCPHCGWKVGTPAEAFALKPGTILDGKYLVGEMLGRGGFGITYIGFDLLLEQKVAIKEYFPMGIVTRANASTVVWSSSMLEKTGTEKGFDSFLKEARKMAKLGSIEGVVGVKTLFIENETAYIVMDFVEGETLQKKLKRDGKMAFDDCLALLLPIMQALSQVHKHGIIHRDISPDNIMIQPDGRPMLLDLGAAKDLSLSNGDVALSQPTQTVAKHGFSPTEQYMLSGKITAATDVYAMAATIYFCCTGSLPTPAIDRMAEDTLCCKPLLDEIQFRALAAGMEVKADRRLQSMDALIQALQEASQESKKEAAAQAEREAAERARREAEEEAARKAAEKAARKAEQEAARRAAQEAAEKAKQEAAEKARLEAERKAAEKAARKAEQEAARRAAREAAEQAKQEAAEKAKQEAERKAAEKAARKAEQEAARRAAREAAAQAKQEAAEKKTDASPAAKSRSRKWLIPAALLVVILAAIPLLRMTRTPAPDAVAKLSAVQEETAAASEVPEETVFFTMAKMSEAGDYRTAHQEPFWGQEKYIRSDVTAIVFRDSMEDAPEDAWDVSEAKDQSVMAWMDSGTLTVAANGTICPNADASELFACFNNLQSIDFGGCFDTSKVTETDYMFWRCKNLTELDLSGFDTSKVTDMRGMFLDCSSLTKLDVSGFDTSKVTRMYAMFCYCSSLTDLDVSHFNTSKVTSMPYMFNGCISLKNLDLSHFDTSKVTEMDFMFWHCLSLSDLDVSGFDTSNVTNMSYMFQGCNELAQLDVSGFDTSNVTDMTAMFENCGSLTSLDLSGFVTSKETKLSETMFRGCSSLTGLKCDDAGIQKACKAACPKVKITAQFYTMMAMPFPKNYKTAAKETFWGQKKYIRSDVTAIVFRSSMDNVPKNAWDVSEAKDKSIMAWMDGGTLTVAADGTIRPNANASNLFVYFVNLQSIDFGGCFDTSNVTSMSQMFSWCESLTGLDVSGFDTSKVTDMGCMFQDCCSLTKLDVSHFDTSNVTGMCAMFNCCSALRELDVSGFDTSNVTDMSYMFQACSSLTSLDLSGFDTSHVTNMSCMFRNCDKLAQLEVSGFDTSNVTDMTDMFNGCSSLTDLKCSDRRIQEAYENR